MMEIKDMLLTVNPYSRPGTVLKAVKGVVVHYVGNPGSTAQGNRNYFENLRNTKATYASSHYIVGLEGEIIRCVPENEIAYCSNSRNSDTISIENCHPLADGKFTEKTYKSLMALLTDLCRRYRLNPLKDVIRHHDVTGKACPLYHVNNPAAWDSLKRDVQTTMDGGGLPEKGYVNLRIDNRPVTEIRADMLDGHYYAKISELARVLGDVQIPVRYVLEEDGKEVGWDGGTKTITGFSSDFQILCRITQAEAGDEDYTGRLLVANVVMNRAAANGFPDTVRDVVFQENQFEPTRNGAYDKAVVDVPTIEAVRNALQGQDDSRGALYFRAIKGATPDCWHEKALTKLFDHGGHRFYR